MQERFEAIAYRARQAKKYGFRTLFHFGAPRMDILYRTLADPAELDRQTCLYSVQREKVIQKYEDLLRQLAAKIPEVDDILMYTFDQEAWVGDEFGNDELAQGVPLSHRLPPFLQRLSRCWKEQRPGKHPLVGTVGDFRPGRSTTCWISSRARTSALCCTVILQRSR